MKRQIAFFIMACIFVASTASAALAGSSATDAIRQTIDGVLDIIKKPEMHDPGKRSALLADVEDRIKTIFDFTEFSARTVGPKWRQFSPDQKTRFEAAFADLLRATYIEKLDGYDGEKVKFIGEVSSTKGDKAEVQTSIMMKDKEIPVSYRLINKNGTWRVYDVRIEKVSLIENYRGQFKELLLKGDAEELIGRVEVKAKEIQQQNKTAAH